MASPLDELKKRFGRPWTASPRRQRSAKTRSDFKGDRKRLHVRLGVRLVEQLELLARARNLNQNSLVEELLSEGVARGLARERERLGEAMWEALTSRAGKGSGQAD